MSCVILPSQSIKLKKNKTCKYIKIIQNKINTIFYVCRTSLTEGKNVYLIINVEYFLNQKLFAFMIYKY